MMRILNRHTAYEALLTEHIDGVISAADDAKLSSHLATCADCTADLREQSALRSLLRAEPLVAAPRSFALPYAPRTAVADEPTGLGKLLRGMQVATAAAAMVLVVLVGLTVLDTSPNALVGSTAADASAPLSASLPESAAPQGAAGIAAEEEAGDGSVSLAAPPADSTLLFEPALEPSPDTGTTERTGDTGLDDGEQIAKSLGSPVLEGDFAPETGLAETAAPNDDRTGLEWALLIASLVTALLAFAVVATTWRARSTTA